jgi:hypothetical protein
VRDGRVDELKGTLHESEIVRLKKRNFEIEWCRSQYCLSCERSVGEVKLVC